MICAGINIITNYLLIQKILFFVLLVIIFLDFHIVGVAVKLIVIFVINNSEEIFLLIRVGKSILMKVKKN